MFRLGRISLPSRVWRTAVVAALAFSIGSATVAFGLVVNGVVFACYHNATGVLRLELAEKPCNTTTSQALLRETRISWNQVGQQGLQGIPGPKGDQGIQGLKGDKGETGDQGIQGLKGDQGIQGVQGLKGDKGDQGLQGIQGPQGEQGPQGNVGPQGVAGQGVEVTPIGSVPQCPAGGIQVTTATSTNYVCHGERGPIGPGTLPQVTSFSAQSFLIAPGIYTIELVGQWTQPGVAVIQNGRDIVIADNGEIRYFDRLVVDGPATQTYQLAVYATYPGEATDGVATTVSVCQTGCQ